MARFSQSACQDQTLIMNLAMKQAFAVLQMPIFELSEWLYCELDKNPVFEVTPLSTCPDLSWVEREDSFYEYLEKEIRVMFKELEQQNVACFIAGSLDAKGFLTLSDQYLCKKFNLTPLHLKNILSRFHKIEPIGLGARSSQEALLLQLEHQGRRQTPIYTLVSKHFDQVLHNRLDLVAKEMSLPIQAVKELITHQLKALDPFPGHQFCRAKAERIIPDLIIDQQDGNWQVRVAGDFLPKIEINPHYTRSLEKVDLKKEEREFIRRHLASGKWLMRTLDRRKKMLMAIGTYILKKQRLFLEGTQSAPSPLKRKQMATDLELSESTITRAIYQKYVETPRGVMMLKTFFPRACKRASASVSDRAAKVLLSQLIKEESKQDPLSDRALSDRLQSQGIPCPRRTVAKYRQELKISPKHRRKEWI